jgi:hypothetical protein
MTLALVQGLLVAGWRRPQPRVHRRGQVHGADAGGDEQAGGAQAVSVGLMGTGVMVMPAIMTTWVRTMMAAPAVTLPVNWRRVDDRAAALLTGSASRPVASTRLGPVTAPMMVATSTALMTRPTADVNVGRG